MSALRSLDARTDRRLRLRVRGAVQGVGFRPFAYGLASRLALSGFVRNDAEGVLIEIEGAGAEQFLHALRLAPPPLARIDSIEVAEAAARRRRRLRDRADRGRAGDDAHRRRRRDLRGLPRRAVRSGEPLLPLSAGQLHPLRAALHADARAALRSRADLDGAVPDVRGLRARLRRSRPIAASTPSRSPARAADPKLNVEIDADRRLHSRRRHRRAEGPRRLPSGLRRAQRGGGGGAAPPQGARGQALRGDGRQCRERGALAEIGEAERALLRVARAADRARRAAAASSRPASRRTSPTSA